MMIYIKTICKQMWPIEFIFCSKFHPNIKLVLIEANELEKQFGESLR